MLWVLEVEVELFLCSSGRRSRVGCRPVTAPCCRWCEPVSLFSNTRTQKSKKAGSSEETWSRHTFKQWKHYSFILVVLEGVSQFLRCQLIGWSCQPFASDSKLEVVWTVRRKINQFAQIRMSFLFLVFFITFKNQQTVLTDTSVVKYATNSRTCQRCFFIIGSDRSFAPRSFFCRGPRNRFLYSSSVQLSCRPSDAVAVGLSERHFEMSWTNRRKTKCHLLPWQPFRVLGCRPHETSSLAAFSLVM